MFGIYFHWIFVPICFVAGVIIIFFRPYWGFLFAIFLNLIFGTEILFWLRIPGIGPYFNLNDVCMYLAILALIVEWRHPRYSFILPNLILVIMVVILIGFFNSFLRYPNDYYALRGFRWALHLPVYFVVGANLVRGEERIKQLLLTIVFAGCVASLQHIFWIMQTRQVVGYSSRPGLFRNIKFLRAEQHAWLIAGAFLIAGKIPRKWLQLGIGALFLVASLTHQTRSIAVAAGGTLVLYYLWFLGKSAPFNSKRIGLLVVIIVTAIFVMGPLKFTGLVEAYWNRISYSWKHFESDISLDSRKRDLVEELGDWKNGNMIIGEGLRYHHCKRAWFTREESLIAITGVGYGHLGYVNYLSQLGIIGFFVYAIWFQWAVLTRARRAFRACQQSPWTAHASALAGVMFLYHSIISFMSGTPYLSHAAVIPSILAGIVWAIHLPKYTQ